VLTTATKILQNILKNPAEDKYRRVRLSNPAIQRKLCVVPGAVELLVAAGLGLHEEGGEQFLQLGGNPGEPGCARALEGANAAALAMLAQL
jgi:UBX domain-containing protein 6